jgi:hypothetical protein
MPAHAIPALAVRELMKPTPCSEPQWQGGQEEVLSSPSCLCNMFTCIGTLVFGCMGCDYD